MAAVQLAAQVCTVLAVGCRAAVLAATRSARLAIGVLVDLLLAAGLLRLTHQVTAGALLAAAAVVAVTVCWSSGSRLRTLAGPSSDGAVDAGGRGAGKGQLR